MILISHRGNLEGKSNDENNPQKIQEVINLGFDVEVDLRYNSNKLYLGHDYPQYLISKEWLLGLRENLWIHCKDIYTIEYIINDRSLSDLHFFFHENDNSTLTSKGFLWVYPGFQPVKKSIAVLPELSNENITECQGICSDNILNYKK